MGYWNSIIHAALWYYRNHLERSQTDHTLDKCGILMSLIKWYSGLIAYFLVLFQCVLLLETWCIHAYLALGRGSIPHSELLSFGIIQALWGSTT